MSRLYPVSRTPFKTGQQWRHKTDPQMRGVICHVLFSRARRHLEAWADLELRYGALKFPFPANDRRACHYLINVDEWERA